MRQKNDRAPGSALSRRTLLKAAGAAGAGLYWVPSAGAAPTQKSAAETSVRELYASLSNAQKEKICFAWDHQVPKRGLLRTFIANNWNVTQPTIDSDFFSSKQQELIHNAFKALFSPEWYPKFIRQLKDDTEGRPWGAGQSVAIFGEPGEGKFQFVFTGRHMTVRADGNSEGKLAFGGPIFHGHAAGGMTEKPDHPNNIFWHQAKLANGVYAMLDEDQRAAALVAAVPARESSIAFREEDKRPGIAVKNLEPEQREKLEKVLASMVEPYRKEDREEIAACLKAQGGLDACKLAFYREDDLGGDGVWDNWRIEGPSMVWYFRGAPHVHIWIHVAEDASVKLNPNV